MIAGIKSLLRRLLPASTFRALADGWTIRTGGYGRCSYAQEAEDLILADLMGKEGPGFYVDVGAYHPVRFSNTWRFYRAGWRGLNVDALPGSMAKFRRWRPRDLNVEAAISSDARTLEFHVFPEAALNTFSRELADARARELGCPYRRISLATRTLRDVLAEHLPPGQVIDFLTLDVESHELDVLRSNDWTRFRPRWLLVESLGRDAADAGHDPVHRLLVEQGYRRVTRTSRTVIYACGDAGNKAS